MIPYLRRSFLRAMAGHEGTFVDVPSMGLMQAQVSTYGSSPKVSRVVDV
jgi:hypothetical protein